MKSARRLSITPGTALALIALFFALGGSAFAVGERIQSPVRCPAALHERSRTWRRDCHRNPESGHREHPRQVHERRQPLRTQVQLHREGSSGASRRDGRLRGPLRRDLRSERSRKRHWRRLRDRRARARAAPSRSRCTRPGATTRSTCRSRSSWCEPATAGAARRPRRGLRRRAGEPAAIATNRKVISLSPGSRPSREPRFS